MDVHTQIIAIILNLVLVPPMSFPSSPYTPLAYNLDSSKPTMAIWQHNRGRQDVISARPGSIVAIKLTGRYKQAKARILTAHLQI